MVSVCAGLVTVDEESNIIRLVHYTTRKYFERTQTRWFPKAQTAIAKTCITYLSFDSFKTGSCPTDEEFAARLRLSPLYHYAARSWGYYVRTALTQEKLITELCESRSNVYNATQAMMAALSQMKELILDLLESEAKVSSATQAMFAEKNYSYESDYSQKVPRQFTGAHIAAYFDLEETMSALRGNNQDPEPKDNYGRTPLSWAAERGQDAVVKLLLAKDGVNPDSKDKSSCTPLSWAAKNGHEAVMKLLLVKDGVDPNPEDKDSCTPLSWAAKNGREAVVELLLAKDGVDPDSKDEYSRTSLSWAAENGMRRW